MIKSTAVAVILLIVAAILICTFGVMALYLLIWAGCWIVYWNRGWLEKVMNWITDTFKFPEF